MKSHGLVIVRMALFLVIIPPNRECVIRLGIGEGANVIFKQVSHTIR